MIRIRLLSIALLAGCTGVAHGEDLLQIYQLARDSDPTLAGAQANKLATDESVTQARAQLLPQIGINLNFSRAVRAMMATSRCWWIRSIRRRAT